MPWSDDTWDAFVAVLQRGFAAKDPFTEADARVYRLLLDGIEPDRALQAVRELVLEGQALRPRPGEIVERCRRDRGAPTFEEAYRLIFGVGGVLAARRPRGARYSTEREGRDLDNAAMLQRASEMHPLIAAFVDRLGLDRLRTLGVDDEDYGEMRRRELREAWAAHVAAFDGRDVVALAAGSTGRGRAGLHSFDPLAALGLTVPAGELTTTTTRGEGPHVADHAHTT